MKKGYNKWGGYCPPDMSWNSTRLKKGLCDPWQNHLYSTWYAHGLFIHQLGDSYNNSLYKGVKFDPVFYNFESFYNYVKTLPGFNDFKKHHELYDIDKDILGGEWTRGSLSIVTKQANSSEAIKRNGHPAHNAASLSKRSISRGHKVKVTKPDGTIEYVTCGNQGCSRKYGICAGSVNNCCHRENHTIRYGKWKGWSFEYVD